MFEGGKNAYTFIHLPLAMLVPKNDPPETIAIVRGIKRQREAGDTGEMRGNGPKEQFELLVRLRSNCPAFGFVSVELEQIECICHILHPL